MSVDFFPSTQLVESCRGLSHIANTFYKNITQSFNGQTTTRQVPQSALTPEGNMFWKAINNSEAYNLLTNIDAGATGTLNGQACATAGSNACTKEILMSLVGTEILRPSASAQGNTVQSNMQNQATSSTPNASDSKKPKPWVRVCFSLILWMAPRVPRYRPVSPGYQLIITLISLSHPTWDANWWILGKRRWCHGL
jgi:hypothetical protein